MARSASELPIADSEAVRDARVHELERRVAELESVSLQLSQDDRRKTELLRQISHDLRNPLTAIRNSLYIVEHAAPGSEHTTRALAVIGRQVDHLTHLLDDLSVVARLAGDDLHRHRVPPAPDACLRVLIIDGDVDAADHLREVLDLEGCKVAVEHDANASIAKALEFHPDVVFCDVAHPGMDGRAIARALREKRALDGAHLLALGSPEQAADADFDQQLSKPPSLESIKLVLERVGSRSAA